MVIGGASYASHEEEGPHSAFGRWQGACLSLRVCNLKLGDSLSGMQRGEAPLEWDARPNDL